MDADKTIFRTVKNKDNPFVMMDRRPLENPTLSWKSKGLLGYLLSRPDNWRINMADLIKRSRDGEHATRAALDELRDAGHVMRIEERDEKGKFLRFIYEVYEVPHPLPENRQMDDRPFGENPQVENPVVENRHINNTESSNTELNKNLGASAPAQPVKPRKPQKQGDVMDGILLYERLAQDKQTQLADRVNAYPPDVQQTLLWFVDVYELLPSAIPAKPRGSKGGDFALWINELREINGVLEGFGRSGIEATRHPCKNLSVSHPGAIMWCLPAEVGKIAARTLDSSRTPTKIPDGDWRTQIQL